MPERFALHRPMARSDSIDASVKSTSGDFSSPGTCHGYEIRSSAHLQTLRRGAGNPLYVEERAHLVGAGALLGTWQPRPGNPFHAKLLQEEDRFWFWASDAGWFAIDPRQPSVWIPKIGNPLQRELRLFGVPTSICTLADGDLSIHASAVEIRGQAVLIAGPSMYGKTTLAAAFASAGHRLLCEDTTRCSVEPVPVVYPGPAVVRLRADVARSLHLRDATAVGREDGRVALVFAASSRGRGDRVPLSAVIFLRESSDPPSLHPVPAAVAARDLFALTFRLPTASSRAECFSRVVDLTTQIPMLDLLRPKTIDSLAAVISLVEGYLDPVSSNRP